ncbi:hypothetical protein DSO57_1023996 [Entomophthora muscae]|uniref:Uncharacterized protein n=1 Tax=Entomophthora muscae TaxID=34485 RepID=A0ACC2SG06_9FUNG|nr:hypothetical protein DSO57_1023996 [Entomophthora muscae]
MISLDMLPYYYLPYIFKYLESDDQHQLRFVSKKWNALLLPFIFSKLSTDMGGELEKYLPKYSEFVRELGVNSLDAKMTDLLSACKNTTRLSIDLCKISPEAALILGENFPLLSHLELYNADSDKVSYLSPLTRKVKTLCYNCKPNGDPKKFMICYSDFECPLVTHLIIEEEHDLGINNFPHIVKRFPAMKTFEYKILESTGCGSEHFVYDVENMVFKEISFLGYEGSWSVYLRFRDDIPSKTPLLSSDQEVTHESQFNAHRSIDIFEFSDFIPQFAYVDAIDIDTSSAQQEELLELVLRLKDIRSLSFDFDNETFSTDLYNETFKARTVFLEVYKYEIPDVLLWLTKCFPNLEELGIFLLDHGWGVYKIDYKESKLTFELWENLVENCSNLSKLHLSDDLPFHCQIEQKYPHISVDNKQNKRCCHRN